MLEAVGAVTRRALVRGHARGVNERLACVFVALLLMVVERRFWWKGCGGILGSAATGPIAFLGAFVGMFGAMVEAICSGGVCQWAYSS
jgi:hypothetical protein